MDTSVQNTILQQLGGKRFLAMVSGECSRDGDSTLIVKFKGSSKANILSVTLNPKDLYDVTFSKWAKGKYEVVKEFKDLYNDQLQETFTEVTGLAVRL